MLQERAGIRLASAARAERRGAYKWWALSCTSLGMLMATINSGTLIIALPDLERALHTPLLELVWVLLVYMIVLTVLVLTAGRLSDLFGRKRAYVLGFAVFTLASLAAGFAQSGGELIGARVLQGIGGAFLFANSVAIVTDAFPRTITAAGPAGMTTLEATSPYRLAALWLALVGIGSGVFNSPNTSAMMGVVPKNHRGVAAGTRTMLQNTGAVISISFVLAIVTDGIPKTALFRIFSGPASGLPPHEVDLFSSNLHEAVLVLAAFSLLGALVSLLRPSHRPERAA